MNTDIRVGVGFWSHPKTKKLVKAAGLEGVRSLQILWAWAAMHRPRGILHDMDAEAVEMAADWDGEPGAFVGACVSIRWIDASDDGYALHDWAEHNPWQVEADVRTEKARNAARARWTTDAQRPLPVGNDAQTCPSMSKHDAQTCPSIAEHRQALCPSPLLSKKKENTNTPPYTPHGGGGVCASAISPMTGEGESEGMDSASVDCESVDSDTSPLTACAGAKERAGGNKAFEAFWEAYPKKAAKKAALKAWQRARDKPALREILAAIEAQKSSPQWTREGGQFIPHPATWLNAGRWCDVEYTPPVDDGRPKFEPYIWDQPDFLEKCRANSSI